MTTSPAQRLALMAAISPDRLRTFQSAAAQYGCDVIDLYLWDRDLASAVMADIAILEVAMRNAITVGLTKLAGGRNDWYGVDLGLDNRSLQQVSLAWSRVPASQRTPGRVVAQLTFGFWRDLLEAGGSVRQGPLKLQTDYEDLWRRELHLAFPGGRQEAASAGNRFTRTWMRDVVRQVHALRNRAAHHEPLVRGFPMPGENRRLTAQQGLDSCHQLARSLDRDLASWLAAHSRTASVLATKP